MNRPLPHQQSKPTSNISKLGELAPRLSSTHRRAVALVPELPKYRAAVVGSVAAGCAGLQQLSPHLEPADGSEETGNTETPGNSKDTERAEDTASSPTEITTDEATQLGDETVHAIQTALAAEYAASWVYGLVTAYLPAPFEKSVERGRSAHQQLARSARELLS